MCACLLHCYSHCDKSRLDVAASSIVNHWYSMSQLGFEPTAFPTQSLNTTDRATMTGSYGETIPMKESKGKREMHLQNIPVACNKTTA